LLEILGLTIVRVDKGIEQLRQRYDFLQFLPSKINVQRDFRAISHFSYAHDPTTSKEFRLTSLN